MKIGLISTAALKTPPDDYGGIERLAYWLAQGLRDKGHRVTVFCLQGSSIPHPRIEGHQEPELATEAAKMVRKGEIDVIIDFTHRKDFMDILPGFPCLNAWSVMHARGPNPVFLSKAQKAHIGRPDAPHVYPGPNMAEYPLKIQARGNYLLYMGAVLPAKQVHLVCEAAKLLGVPALIAGPVFNESYYMDHIRPYVESGVATLIGPVGGEEKISYIRDAACLVHPVGGVGWLEAGAIVVLESMLLGVPVVGSSNGCLPEYIQDGKNGYIADFTPRDIAAKVEKSRTLRMADVLGNYPWECIQPLVANQYETLAARVMGGETW